MSTTLDPWYKARVHVVDYVHDVLAGPGPDTAIKNPPLNEILIGILHPSPSGNSNNTAIDAGASTLADVPFELNRPNVENDEAQTADDSIMGAYNIRPTSMGLTFSVSGEATATRVLLNASAISYSKIDDLWVPNFHEFSEPWEINLRKSTGLFRREVTPGLNLEAIVRPEQDQKIRITATLVNSNMITQAGKSDELCFFQPKISVTTPNGEFLDGGATSATRKTDPDAAATDFLYRKSKNYASGHGCATWWDEEDDRCRRIETTYFPRQEVKLANPTGGAEGDPYGEYTLPMSRVGTREGYAELHKLADAYEAWIKTRRADLKQDSTIRNGEDFKQAEDNLEQAEKCLDRIREGIGLIEGDTDVGRAFSLMNRAMLKQRQKFSGSGESYWRPFQIAYILLNLPGLSNRKSSDREVADLLWFPTGGGKTEAYLGCIAFTILLRRIEDPADAGVSAIMRYTLRLLTTDQFKRAAALVCGLEVIRRQELPTTKPISLGMWVGDSTTPNTIKDAKAILDKIASGLEPDEGSTPVQLLSCPWCGETLNYQNYKIQNDELRIFCPNVVCDFHDQLPLYVVDSDVYDQRPSLIIGTVDKFAQMTWREKVSELFSMDGKYSAPDLIVQDELHLITGPLGTMVGLYESALDTAFTHANQGLRPKILASTATIRRANDQVSAVFDRSAVQFPPPGITPEDNYFSQDASRTEKGTREYVGIFAPGQSQTTQLVWLYAAILQAAETLDAPDEVRDTYWTLLGYFNSLRVLGSAYIQSVDDVPKRAAAIAESRNEPTRDLSTIEPLELTSRVASTKIPAIREKMDISYPGLESPNIVVATNMISVGLDIDRLGLMVVAGQPQDSSEYIQATSRVGRKYPGLVFVALNSSKTRDVSHFESFIPFHRSLYRAVEATTVTPFSSRARDRGAHGVLIAASRMMIDELRGDRSAGYIDQFAAEVRSKVIPPLVERARRVAPRDAEAFEKQLQKRLQTWVDEASSGTLRLYGKMHSHQAAKHASESLISPASGEQGASSFGERNNETPWATLTSLRNVDAETQLYECFTKREENK